MNKLVNVDNENKPILKFKSRAFLFASFIFPITEKTGSQDVRDGEACAPSCCMDRSGVPGSVQRRNPGWYVR